jgi:hypothetical protein
VWMCILNLILNTVLSLILIAPLRCCVVYRRTRRCFCGVCVRGLVYKTLFSAVWCVSVWTSIGCPPAFNLVEMGPGKGTLMRDVLKATKVRVCECALW